MLEITRLLLFLAIACIGFMVAKQRHVAADRTVRLLLSGLLLVFFVLVISGWARPEFGLANFHTWAGQTIVIAAWLGIPFLFGVDVQKRTCERILKLVAHAATLVTILALVILTSMSGYLGPSHNKLETVEELNRFTVLHLFALPGLLLMLIALSFFLIWPRGRR